MFDVENQAVGNGQLPCVGFDALPEANDVQASLELLGAVHAKGQDQVSQGPARVTLQGAGVRHSQLCLWFL